MPNQNLTTLATLIGDDSHACSFQSLGQYRKALLEVIAKASTAPEMEPVAYLHQVVCGDAEPDQALSFEADSFPLSEALGYRSLSHAPLFTHAAPHPVSGERRATDGWISPSERLPDVPAGDDLDVLVAVRRAHNGKVYVFTTSYLNRYPVIDHDQFIQDDDNDHREITGWFYLSDDEETWHRTLGEKDELVAWQLKPAEPSEVAAHRAQQGEQP